MTVLLVDDNRDLLRFLAVGLRNAGLNVLTAESATEAKRRLHSTATPDADAVVLDYMLPDGNGVELGVELLQEKRELTVIVITGTILPLEEENLCEEHNFLVLRKPFSPEQLAHLIFERLAERHLSAKLRSIDDDPGLSAANLSIAFDPRLKPGQITEVLTALADYYRACGGVGFQIEFELDNLIGSDQVNVA